MRINKTHLVIFSPCQGTLVTLRAIAGGLEGPVAEIDLTMPQAREEKHVFGENDLVLIGFPVYGGRLPHVAKSVFAAISGRNTPAVLIGVYGNRDYEDALLEMQREAESNGFVPFAAAAALAEHVMVPEVAANRPDSADIAALSGFGRSLAAYVRAMSSPADESFTAPGVFPYRKETIRAGIAPKAFESCTRCGACATVCPTGAIPPTAPDTANGEACIICMACVRKCPVEARKPAHPSYAQAVSWLQANCTVRKEPEFFPEILR